MENAGQVGARQVILNRTQRVAVTSTAVIVPKGRLSSEEVTIPWNGMKGKHSCGPVDTIRFKSGMFSKQLTSPFVATDEGLLNYLRQQDKVK